MTHSYARVERERRFLLEALPPEVDPEAYERLVDRYVSGTYLRLRRVESPTGELLQLKLGQKLLDPDAPSDPRRRLMTTLYLPPGEERVLAALPGKRTQKRRYRIAEQGKTFSIDVYEAPEGIAGTILAEVECVTDAELAAVKLPAWATREVTDESRWTGALMAMQA